jgi:hypothetical protein
VGRLGRVRDKVNASVRLVQKIVVVSVLFVIYFVGIGVTRFFVWIFYRHLLFPGEKTGKSFWHTVVYEEPNLEKMLRQS